MGTIWKCSQTGKEFKRKIDLDTYHKVIGKKEPVVVPPPQVKRTNEEE